MNISILLQFLTVTGASLINHALARNRLLLRLPSRPFDMRPDPLDPHRHAYNWAMAFSPDFELPFQTYAHWIRQVRTDNANVMRMVDGPDFIGSRQARVMALLLLVHLQSSPYQIKSMPETEIDRVLDLSRTAVIHDLTKAIRSVDHPGHRERILASPDLQGLFSHAKAHTFRQLETILVGASLGREEDELQRYHVLTRLARAFRDAHRTLHLPDGSYLNEAFLAEARDIFDMHTKAIGGLGRFREAVHVALDLLANTTIDMCRLGDLEGFLHDLSLHHIHYN